MNKIIWLNEIEESDYLIVGDPVFNLSYLQQNNYPVVNGLVVNSLITRDFLSNFERNFEGLDVDNYQTLQYLSQQKYQEVINYNLPDDLGLSLTKEIAKLNSKFVICRYSFIESNKHIHNLSSLLDGEFVIINSANIITGIKQLCGNLFTAKILFYCQKIGLKFEDIQFSIIVQSIKDYFASGFVHINENIINIKASYGLSYGIFRGEVLADLYEIDGQSGDILKQELGKKSVYYPLNLKFKIVSETEQNKYCLNNYVLKELIDLSQDFFNKTQNYDGFEWVICNHKLMINRVIKVNNKPKSNYQKLAKPEPILKGIAASNGKKYASVQVISGYNYHFQPIEMGKILVTKNVTPDWLPLLKKAAGIITEEGGITSHVAIMARELGIPAIVGAKNATKLLKTGESIVIDGNTGNIYADVQGLENEVILLSDIISKNANNLVNFETEIRTKLLVNLSESSLIDRAVNLPIDGVGLIRGDFILLGLISESSLSLKEWLEEENKLILVNKWVNLISKFAKSFAPKPIFYRSLDWLNFNNLTEINPLSSERGTLSYLSEDSLFNLELEMLARVQSFGYTNVNLILPFVRSVDEFIFCRNLVNKIGLNRYKSFKLLIMAEVPSVIFLLPEYMKNGVQGIAIGTNDLTQLLLGIEREKSFKISSLTAINPAVLSALQQLIKVAKEGGIYTCICGQAPAEYPELINYLIDWGIDAISVDLEAIERTFQVILAREKNIKQP